MANGAPVWWPVACKQTSQCQHHVDRQAIASIDAWCCNTVGPLFLKFICTAMSMHVTTGNCPARPKAGFALNNAFDNTQCEALHTKHNSMLS
jgi:hypothetical protein